MIIWSRVASLLDFRSWSVYSSAFMISLSAVLCATQTTHVKEPAATIFAQRRRAVLTSA